MHIARIIYAICYMLYGLYSIIEETNKYLNEIGGNIIWIIMKN